MISFFIILATSIILFIILNSVCKENSDRLIALQDWIRKQEQTINGK
jgi:hypothetical protein